MASENVDCPLVLATQLPDPTLICYFINHHGVDVNFIHKRGDGRKQKIITLLLVAVKRQLYQTVDELLALRADPDVRNHKGRTALHYAIMGADYKMAKRLCMKGANVNLQDKFEDSPVHMAARFGHIELIKLLYQYGADLYKGGPFGAIPMHIAAEEGHVGMVRLFVQQDVGVNTKVTCDEEGREKAPLHIACEQGHIEEVIVLLDQLKADVNLQCSEGETPLHCCVIREYDNFGMKSKDDFAEVTRALIEAGAFVNARNGRGETPLHLAARNEFQRVVEILVSNGANPLIEDNDGNKPIELVSEDDGVTKQNLKRAMTEQEAVLSEVLEVQRRGFR